MIIIIITITVWSKLQKVELMCFIIIIIIMFFIIFISFKYIIIIIIITMIIIIITEWSKLPQTLERCQTTGTVTSQFESTDGLIIQESSSSFVWRMDGWLDYSGIIIIIRLKKQRMAWYLGFSSSFVQWSDEWLDYSEIIIIIPMMNRRIAWLFGNHHHDHDESADGLIIQESSSSLSPMHQYHIYI